MKVIGKIEIKERRPKQSCCSVCGARSRWLLQSQGNGMICTDCLNDEQDTEMNQGEGVIIDWRNYEEAN
jgi:hypothetical protein